MLAKLTEASKSKKNDSKFSPKSKIITKPVQNLFSWNLHIMMGKMNIRFTTFSFQYLEFSKFTLILQRRPHEKRNAPIDRYTCENKTKRANFENFKHWIAESQNPKSKITRKYSNILYNAFCKIKYHCNKLLTLFFHNFFKFHHALFTNWSCWFFLEYSEYRNWNDCAKNSKILNYVIQLSDQS